MGAVTFSALNQSFLERLLFKYTNLHAFLLSSHMILTPALANSPLSKMFPHVLCWLKPQGFAPRGSPLSVASSMLSFYHFCALFGLSTTPFFIMALSTIFLNNSTNLCPYHCSVSFRFIFFSFYWASPLDFKFPMPNGESWR